MRVVSKAIVTRCGPVERSADALPHSRGRFRFGDPDRFQRARMFALLTLEISILPNTAKT